MTHVRCAFGIYAFVRDDNQIQSRITNQVHVQSLLRQRVLDMKLGWVMGSFYTFKLCPSFFGFFTFRMITYLLISESSYSLCLKAHTHTHTYIYMVKDKETCGVGLKQLHHLPWEGRRTEICTIFRKLVLFLCFPRTCVVHLFLTGSLVGFEVCEQTDKIRTNSTESST